ncbi:hypothetical protein SLE2022_039540 [Rubroshorea leprosula]
MKKNKKRKHMNWMRRRRAILAPPHHILATSKEYPQMNQKKTTKMAPIQSPITHPHHQLPSSSRKSQNRAKTILPRDLKW